jgi:hypothetical protein
MNQTILNNEKRHFVKNKTDISVCVRKCSKYRKFLNVQNTCMKMQSFQFVLLIFRFEAPVLLREVARDVFLVWASGQQTVFSVTALYVCQSHIAVLLLDKESYSMQDSAKTISVATKNYLLWNENEQSANNQQFSQLTYN